MPDQGVLFAEATKEEERMKREQQAQYLAQIRGRGVDWRRFKSGILSCLGLA